MQLFCDTPHITDFSKWLIFDVNSDMNLLKTIQQYIDIDTTYDYFTFKETIEETVGYSDATKDLIEDRLSKVKIAIILITVNTLKNPWTIWEINTAIRNHIYIVGITIQDNEEIKTLLSDYKNKKILLLNQSTFKKEIENVLSF